MNYNLCDDQQVVLTSKHQKSLAIAPPFQEFLGARVIELELDTDALGTFSGEVLRRGTAFECVKRKCLWGLEHSGLTYGLASEGSFGQHPSIPGVPSDLELLCFIDRHRELDLTISHLSVATNFSAQVISSLDELNQFATGAKFPSHALILRPNCPNQPAIRSPIFKGVKDSAALMAAFDESISRSSDGKAWVETDMRAHMNPTRMRVIQQAAEIMARRLATLCPECDMPGWGLISIEKGLPCEVCGLPTEMIQYQVLGCTKCSHQQRVSRSDGLVFADPGKCSFCNP